MPSDHEAISRLVFEYAECIDAGDFAGVADLLAEAEVTGEGATGAVRGRDAILRLYERTTRRYEDGTPRTSHVTTNLIVDVDEGAGTATCRSSFTVLQAVPGALALQPIVAGRYRDRFTRVSARWRFASRQIVVELVGDLGQHLLPRPPA